MEEYDTKARIMRIVKLINTQKVMGMEELKGKKKKKPVGKERLTG